MEQLKAQVPGLVSAQYRPAGPNGSMTRLASSAPIKVGMEISVDSARGGARPATGQC